MDFLPQACKAAGEQAIGLLGGVLADQQELAQYRRDLVIRHGGQAGQQLAGARQAQAVEGDFQAFGGFRLAGVGRVVGFAHYAEHQRGAVLHQFGDVAQGAAVVVDGLQHTVVAVLRNRHANPVEQLYPGL